MRSLDCCSPRICAAEALQIVERIRARLAGSSRESAIPPFTASFGVADSSMASHFEQVVRIPDQALHASNDAGRDRATIGDPSHAAPPAPRYDAEHDATIDVPMLAADG